MAWTQGEIYGPGSAGFSNVQWANNNRTVLTGLTIPNTGTLNYGVVSWQKGYNQTNQPYINIIILREEGLYYRYVGMLVQPSCTLPIHTPAYDLNWTLSPLSGSPIDVQAGDKIAVYMSLRYHYITGTGLSGNETTGKKYITSWVNSDTLISSWTNGSDTMNYSGLGLYLVGLDSTETDKELFLESNLGYVERARECQDSGYTCITNYSFSKNCNVYAVCCPIDRINSAGTVDIDYHVYRGSGVSWSLVGSTVNTGSYYQTGGANIQTYITKRFNSSLSVQAGDYVGVSTDWFNAKVQDAVSKTETNVQAYDNSGWVAGDNTATFEFEMICERTLPSGLPGKTLNRPFNEPMNIMN